MNGIERMQNSNPVFGKSNQLKTRWRKPLKQSQSAAVVLLLSLTLGACGTFAGPLVEALTPAKLTYPNPPRPEALIPPQSEVGPIQYWAQQRHPHGDLVCMTSAAWVNLRAFRKEVSGFARQCLKSLDYHEKMNGPHESKEPSK